MGFRARSRRVSGSKLSLLGKLNLVQRSCRSGQSVDGGEVDEDESEEEEEEKAYDVADDDESAGGDKGLAQGARKYLHPLEVKEQMRLLWKAEKKLVARIWGKAPMAMVSLDVVDLLGFV